MPGVLDAHVHFRQPGYEWKEDLRSGSMAAAAGGVTSFFEMPNTKPATIDSETLKDKKQLAAQHALVNYNFFIGATPDNLDELNKVKNVPGIKVFMGSSTGDLLVDQLEDLERIFKNGERLIAVHAEDEAIIQASKAKIGTDLHVSDHTRIRHPEAALKATKIAVQLAKTYQRRLHILHLTTHQEVAFLASENLFPLVTTEVCPHHLFFHAPEAYQSLGTLVQVNPPIRDKKHAQELWEGLTSGVINMVASDHAPHTQQEKQQPYGESPSGMPGVETMLPLLLDQVNQGKCQLQDIVKWLCEAPSACYGVKEKGKIEKGYDADLVLVDMNKASTVQGKNLHSKAGWTAYEGWTLKGWPLMTFVNGVRIYQEGTFFEEKAAQEVICS